MEHIIYQFLNNTSLFVILIVACLSLYTLSKGADIFVDEAVYISLTLGIPKIIVGATIVSLGTTLPEASVSVIAAINGNPDLALGNAIGSIIVDTGLIIGVASLIGELKIDKKMINRQGLAQFGAVILLALMSLPIYSDGDTGNISQMVGFIFIFILVFYIYISIKWSKDSSDNDNSTVEKKSIFITLIKLVLGIVIIIASSKVLIPAISVGATKVGISQSIIAATIVAFGTSLPELVTAVTAVKKGHGELAIGNIVGADILNVLFVVGASAAVTKGGLNVPIQFLHLQIPTMLLIVTAFRIFAKNEGYKITKKEGIFLIGIYLAYVIINYI